MKIAKTIVLLTLLMLSATASAAAIDTTNKWSWGETVGWMNWNTVNGTAVDVTDTAITGEVWTNRHGWINLAPLNAGVTNTCAGDVGGHAWGENIGYIDMSGVSINPVTGIFSGTAMTDSYGSIQFGGVNFDLETEWICDTDGDGFPDSIETAAGSDPTLATSVPADTDGDGFPDIYETTIASPVTDETDTSEFPMAPDPLATDTDGDGYPDWLEEAAGSDPDVTGSVPTDTDGDLVPDIVELMQGTDSTLPLDYMDDDGDLVPNYIEAKDVTDATDPTVGGYLDTDGDLVPDYVEVTRQPNAGDAATDENDINLFIDTDTGTVPDYVEVTLFPNEGLAATDPNVIGDDTQDTDNGGVTDYDELKAGTDPTVKDGSEVSSGGGGSSAKKVCKDEAASNYSRFGKSTPSLCEYDTPTDTTTDEEESTTDPITVEGSVCAPYLTESIRFGSANDSEEVNKLIDFLNDKQGEDLERDGTYDQDDFDAVKRFQLKFSDEVLNVWGLTAPTGFVYITTRNKINSFYCDADIQCPYFVEHNRLNQNDNTNEVLKTKILMTELGFYSGTLNESWGEDMKQAIIDFQETFSATMLKPWGLTKGTGYKYKTTNRYLNDLVGCEVPPETLDNGVRVSF